MSVLKTGVPAEKGQSPSSGGEVLYYSEVNNAGAGNASSVSPTHMTRHMVDLPEKAEFVTSTRVTLRPIYSSI